MNYIRFILCLIATTLLSNSALAFDSFYFTSGENTFASIFKEWKGAFYTDDSKYYFQMHRDGFTQRFRVHRDYCSGIQRVNLVFKNGENKVAESKALMEIRNTEWPDLYGINEDHYCWFEVEAHGMDLNKPQENSYAVEIVYNGEVFYLQGFKDSILPAKRLVKSLDNITWIELGPNGATPVTDGGVFFKIWEPVVDEVKLIVNDGSPLEMAQDLKKGDEGRSHVLYLENAEVGDEYSFFFEKDGQVLKQVFNNISGPTPLKVDPMAREIVYDRKGGYANGYVNPRAVVQGNSDFEWENDDVIASLDPLERSGRIIYQVWPLTFNPQKVNGKYVSGTFNDIRAKIDYISDLGVNAVELLPIHESKFYATWGYALDSFLLLQKQYGTGDDLRKLSDVFHERKIQLILDVVLNHINNDLIREPISMTNDQSKFYDGSTDWGPRPKFSSVHVQRWMADSLVSLIQDYHIDGFRFDMTKYIYGGNEGGYRFLQDLTTLLRTVSPFFSTDAEELPDNVWATKPVEEGGIGFTTQWNDKFKNAFEEEFAHFREYHRQLNLSPLLGALYGYSNHVDYGTEYNFGHPLSTVNYLGSHDFIGNKNPILRIVSDYNFYERVDNNYFARVKPLEDPVYERFSLIHNQFTHGVGKTAYGILFTKPGNVLFYQGEELGNDINIENEWSYVNAQQNNSFPSQDVDINRFVGSHRMPWEYLDPHNSKELDFITDDDKDLFRGTHNFFKDMISFRRAHPKMNLQNAYDVQVHGNILTYVVDAGVKRFFVVANFGEDINGEWISFPRGADSWWVERFNSSDDRYFGHRASLTNAIASLGGRANHLRLAGPAIYVFERVSKGELAQPLFVRGSMNNWGVDTATLLKRSSDQGNLYSSIVEIPEDGEFEFKIASQDWLVEYGAPKEGANIEVFGGETSGMFTNVANAQNIKLKLKKGTYRFILNIMDYKFSFIKLEL